MLKTERSLKEAQAALRRLAEALEVPVAPTASGKGVFAETHPRALGVLGTFALEAANAVAPATAQTP